MKHQEAVSGNNFIFRISNFEFRILNTVLNIENQYGITKYAKQCPRCTYSSCCRTTGKKEKGKRVTVRTST